MSLAGTLRLMLAMVTVTGLTTGWTATCPDFVKKTAQIGKISELPVKGIVVGARRYGGGLYSTALGSQTHSMIPTTQSDVNANSVQISDDGRWVVYNAGGIFVIGIDGRHRTRVPVNASGSEGCCALWWNGPKGTEIVYREPDNKVVRAIGMSWSENGPSFGTDRVVARFSHPLEFSMGIAVNRMWVRINDSKFHPQFVTIPDNGNGIAGDSDLWEITNAPAFGCMTTLSHDGTIACYNEGYLQWCDCLADEFCLLRHKSFVLLPFKEKSDPVIRWDTLVMTRSVSVNWAPAHFVMVDSNNLGSDFKNWNFTNDNNYIVGDLMGQRVGADSGSVWLVHWPSNTWTRVLSVSKDTLIGFGSAWIDKSSDARRGMPHNRLMQHRNPGGAVPYMVDIRGCRQPARGSGCTALTPGVYYTVSPDGVTRRIVTGR